MVNAGEDVIILQHVSYEGPGRIGDVLRDAGLQVRIVETYNGHAIPKDLSQAAGLVVLGGPEAGDDSRWSDALCEEMVLIGKALDRRLPIFSVSLGAELLAATLGARVTPPVYLECGWHEYSLLEAAHTDPLFDDESSRFRAFHWHGDIFQLPRGAVPLVTGGFGGCQAFRWGEATYGFRFHPEITAAQIMRLVHAFLLDEPTLEGEGEAISTGIGLYAPSMRTLCDRLLQRWVARVCAGALART